MLLNNQDIQQTIILTELTSTHCLNLIQTYIHEKTGYNVGEINQPNTLMRCQLMNIAFEGAVKYYANKFNP